MLVLWGSVSLIEMVVIELMVLVIEIGVGNVYIFFDEIVLDDWVCDIVVNVKV